MLGEFVYYAHNRVIGASGHREKQHVSLWHMPPDSCRRNSELEQTVNFGFFVPSASSQTRSYANAFATALTHQRDDAITSLAKTLVSDFDAERAELWLWNQASNSCYLADSDGSKAEHRLDRVPMGTGVIGKLAADKKSIENVALSAFDADDLEFSRQTGLVYITGHPLLAEDKLLGMLAIYTRVEASAELLL